VRYPRWTPEGDIVAIIQEIEETPTITRVSYTVQRVDAATGKRVKLLDDAYAIAISPDGMRMAYARPLMEGGEAFESIDIDGGGAASVIVSADANLLPFNSPQYSPDGASIAFASADQAAAPVGMRAGSLKMAAKMHGGGWRMDGGVSTVAALDGLPQDIWLVDAAGGRPRLLAAMKEDLPSLTWSGDGQQIYVLGSTGLYQIEVASAAVTRIGEGVFHGQIVWAPGLGDGS
jgi:Tol biopolymer transport system component